MLTWIISTAQQARPKVIHHRLPVRAQVNRSSVEATRKPFSSSSLAHRQELGFLGAAGDQPGRARKLFLGRMRVGRGVEHHSHSSAPFFHA